MTDGLKPEYRRAIIETLSANPKVERVVLFGSRAMGTFTPTSDIDLALFGDDLTLSDQAALTEAMAELAIPQRVDILIHHRIENQALRDHIRKHGVEWFARKRASGTTNMAGEWREVALGELVDLFDGPHATPPKTERGPVFLGISNLANGRLNLAETEHLSESDFVRWTRRVEPQPGDVVFSYETRLGEAASIPRDLRCCLGRRMGLLRPRPGAIDNRFLLYAYLGPQFQDVLRSRAVHGSTVDRIPLEQMPGFPIRVPIDLSEQRAIAHILGTLDDKIELNRRMSETLEAMARALFKSWFVDFDPVRAKAEGRDPGLPQPLADLFPDSFEDSELGEIPKGWEVRPFADTVDIIGGGTPKTSVADYWNGDIPWFSIVDAPTPSEVWVVDTKKKITREAIENSAARVLPVGTTIISARGTVGRVALVGVPMAMNQSCYGLRGRTGAHGFFNYFSIRELVARLQQHAHGSVFDTITRDTLAGVSVVVPPARLVDNFENRVGPSLDRVRAGLMESRTLAQLRDALLPKLISGELRVKDAERFMKEWGM